MLKKTPIKKSNKTSVLFQLSELPEKADAVCLVGEFNEWKLDKTPMKKRKDGAWSVAMRLPNTGRFEYGFVVDGEEWIADEAADDFVSNPYGGKNSVVILGGAKQTAPKADC